MKRLLLSTALVAASAFGAVAQTADMPMFQTEADPMALRASELIGMRVYNSEAPVEGDAVAGAGQEWDDLGEINDVILSRDGMVQAVLVDVGGFLGVGERQVAVSMSALRILSDDATGDNPGDFFLVMNAPRETLEQAPAYTMDGMGDAATGAAAGAAAGAAVVGTAVADGTEATGDAMVDGAEATGDAVVEGAEATGDVIEDGAEATADAVTDGAEATADAVTGDGTGGTSDAVTDGTATTAGTEGGTSDAVEAEAPVEGGTSDAATDGTATTAGTDTAMTEGEAMAEGADATTSTTGADAEAQATRQPIEREGFAAAAPETLTAETLTGARVYDANDEWIGDVSELVLNADGQIDQAIVDVGGFLGIGEKPVSVPLTDMDILQQSDGDEVRVFLQRTKEELEALPTYEG